MPAANTRFIGHSARQGHRRAITESFDGDATFASLPDIRMKILASSCLAAAFMAAVPCAHASTASDTAPAAVEFHCPATLAQTPASEGVPPGWVAQGGSGEWALQRATFYDGDPVGLGARVPDATHRNGQVETSTWQLGTGDSAQVWLACLYRDATPVVARPLPTGLHQCTTILRLNALGDPAGVLSVQCR